MLIEGLKTICEIVNIPDIKEQLMEYTPEEQWEIYLMMREIMADEIEFVIHMYEYTIRKEGMRGVN
ncbi:hypothetical protein CathTA2_0821 [Caldalkalibacillus thermarum TA2.A1]|uniref:Uncharacterized protein n=1 Tax=Caldalkalibacillus thermarum (strain TA2.A1) TaxID=986075 RepID=F5L4V8_CALTT|nr:hypothetical protein [Caldalkalibacillus thermarum]EGL83610.1 hypothetical protein CathTA2_0821 [Caldalkalibacillus thermarum TA2.A1]QZT33703.1 hypothetical protein HUR95_16010 [Caldalkalibacillus thermarum TA2.A1]GGK22927.1 hypothetical protein GCM10010965_14740 [Caldalkalibacillus thermarum]